MELQVGTRVRCESCGSEAIITGPADATIECCGQPVTVIFTPADSEAR